MTRDELECRLHNLRSMQPPVSMEIADICREFDELRETLRDRFAMAALTGLLSYGESSEVGNDAALAYKLADACLAEKAKRKTPEAREDTNA